MGKFRELVLLEREIEAIEANIFSCHGICNSEYNLYLSVPELNIGLTAPSNKLNATIASSILILLTEELNTKKHEFKEVALRLLKEFDEN
tara:strand:- start:61347 stop:61616 length:270 start_codon:yes stop_codon:yes gene_type:complete